MDIFKLVHFKIYFDTERNISKRLIYDLEHFKMYYDIYKTFSIYSLANINKLYIVSNKYTIILFN